MQRSKIVLGLIDGAASPKQGGAGLAFKKEGRRNASNAMHGRSGDLAHLNAKSPSGANLVKPKASPQRNMASAGPRRVSSRAVAA